MSKELSAELVGGDYRTHLFVHLPDEEPGQSHPSDGADQLHRGAVVVGVSKPLSPVSVKMEKCH